MCCCGPASIVLLYTPSIIGKCQHAKTKPVPQPSTCRSAHKTAGCPLWLPTQAGPIGPMPEHSCSDGCPHVEQQHLCLSPPSCTTHGVGALRRRSPLPPRRHQGWRAAPRQWPGPAWRRPAPCGSAGGPAATAASPTTFRCKMSPEQARACPAPRPWPHQRQQCSTTRPTLRQERTPHSGSALLPT